MTELRGESGLVVVLDERGPDLLVASLQGDLGGLEGADLEAFLLPLASRRGLVVLDLSEVGVISSLAMGVLMSLQRGLKSRDGRVRLAGVQPRVLESLQHVRVDALIGIYPSVADALKDEV